MMAQQDPAMMAALSLLSEVLAILARTNRGDLEEILRARETTLSLNPAVLSPSARNTLPQSMRIQIEMLKDVLGEPD